MAPTVQTRTAGAAPTHAANASMRNPVQTVGTVLLLLFLFLIYSRLLDMYFYWLHLPKLLKILMIPLVVMSGQTVRVMWRSPIGRYLTLFSAWAIATVPFAYWRGGAWSQATATWPQSWLILVCAGCFLGSVINVRRAVYSLGFGVAGLAIIARIFGDLSTGRLTMERGEFANPNDLAIAVLMGLPLLIFVIMEGGAFLKVAACAACVPIFWALIHTISRTGLIGFGVVVIFVFFRCSLSGRMMLMIATVMVLAAAVFLLPHSLLDRYTTLFHADVNREFQSADANADDPGAVLNAAGTAEERYGLLMDSIVMTFKHPIWGVGMGNFSTVRWNEAKAAGTHVRWLVSHNSYTEVSSETGLVGFVLYMGAMVGTVRLLSQLKKFANARIHPQSQTISRIVFCLQASLMSYAATSFFASVAFAPIFPTLAGLVVALAYAVEPEFSIWKKQNRAGGQSALQPVRVAAPSNLLARRSASA